MWLPFYKKYFGVDFTKKNIIIFRDIEKKNDSWVQTLGVVFTLLNRFSADKKNTYLIFFNPL